MEEINLAENEKALHDMREKRKKSKKRKKFIIPLVIVGVIIVIILGVIIAGAVSKKPVTVNVVKPQIGDIEQTISVTGNVASNQVVTYYAPASVKVNTIAEEGSLVKKGDVLASFDEDDVAYAIAVASLQGDINDNNYKQALAQYNKTRSEYNEAKQKVTQYTDLVNAQQAEVDRMKNELTDTQYSNLEATVNKNKELSEVEVKLNSIASTVLAPIQKEMQKLDPENPEDKAALEGLTEQYDKLCEESGYNELSKKASDIRKSLNELDAASRSIGATSGEQQKQVDAQRLLAEYEAELSKAKATVSQYEASSSSYDKNGIELNNELATLQANHQMEELDKVLDGLVADFDGVVTKTFISSGDTAVAGSGVVSIASFEDVYIKIGVTKNDLKKMKEGQKAKITILGNEYEGTIQSISKVVTVSDKGAAQITATITIDNPDDNIFLGIDAKAVISTAKSEGCLTLPVESVFADSEGEFVYVVENGIVVKKYVETGISSNRFIEILDGVTEEDLVMKSAVSNVSEGSLVNPVDQDAIMTAIGGGIIEETTSEIE